MKALNWYTLMLVVGGPCAIIYGFYSELHDEGIRRIGNNVDLENAVASIIVCIAWYWICANLLRIAKRDKKTDYIPSITGNVLNTLLFLTIPCIFIKISITLTGELDALSGNMLFFREVKNKEVAIFVIYTLIDQSLYGALDSFVKMKNLIDYDRRYYAASMVLFVLKCIAGAYLPAVVAFFGIKYWIVRKKASA